MQQNMKNISLGLFFSLFFSISLWGQFTKIYGNADENYPLKVKSFNSHTYVLGSRKIGTTEYATFSKFTNTGVLVWDYQLSIPSKLLDFEYTGANNRFLLVGRTEPLDIPGAGVQDNKSLLVRITDNVTSATALIVHYDHTGRESFTRIIRHTNPLPSGTPFQFYVLGHKNERLPPSTTDQMMLYNINSSGSIRPGFPREYTYQFELEGHYGMFQKSNGNVVVLGAAAPNNDGIVIEINGVTGAAGRANKYNYVNNNAQFDFYDGIELPDRRMVIAGTDFVTKNGILLMLDNVYDPIFGSRFDNISEFQELGRDANGSLYVVGPAKNPPHPVDYSVLTRVTVGATAFSSNLAAYYSGSETDFKTPHLSVTPSDNRVFFADSRIVSSGNFDMLVGDFDLNFNTPNSHNNCKKPFTNSITPFLPIRMNIMVTDAFLVSKLDDGGMLQPLGALNSDFCTSCTASFVEQAGPCLSVQFTGMGTSTGTGTLQYSWTINGGLPVSSLQNPTLVFPGSGTYTVCLTVTDPTTMCVATFCKKVIVPPASPPTCIIPANLTANTDPGKCTAFLSPIVSGTGCAPVTITATLSGGLGTFSGPSPLLLPANYPKGITTITVSVTDANSSVMCNAFTVTVIDKEAPIITCPQNINRTVPFCDGGAIVNFPAPLVTDNCPMVSYTCSHQSGSFFPCGKTTVTCTATDMSNNTSTCTFDVNINCQCAEIGAKTIVCDPLIDDKYLFTIQVNSLSGTSSCVASVSGPGVMANPISFSGTGVISGMITVTGGVIPPLFNLVVTVKCTCPNGQVSNCTFPVTFTLICCKHISIKDQSICATDQQVLVPLIGCGQFQNIQQVNWWVATGPIPPPFPGPGWVLQQGGFDCSPLLLFPHLYTDNIWVQAIMTVGDFPCSIVTSNIASITLCKPVSCNVSPSLQEFCYTGSPITAANLTVNPSGANCPILGIDWSGPGVPSGQTGANYQPSGLSTSNSTACFEDFTYTATIKSICGNQTCTATVRLFNDAASMGLLDMSPLEITPPFCPGEDFTLKFDPNCVSHPPASSMWNWSISTTGPNTGFSPITGSGNMNPLWNTNQVFVDTWYQVQGQNGVCPPDSKTYMIDVMDELTLVSFTATEVMTPPDCETTGVDLAVSFLPNPADPNCPVKITWIKNGEVLFVSTHTTSPATWTYTDPMLLGNYSGNYWVIIERTCCKEIIKSDLVTIDPPCFIQLTGPCFITPKGTAVLTGQLVNPRPFTICDDQWSYLDNTGQLSFLSSNSSIVVGGPGQYIYQVFCDNGCIKTATFNLTLCTNSCTNDATDLNGKTFSINIFPNPNPGNFTVELPQPATSGMTLRVTDLAGRLVLEKLTETGNLQQTIQAEYLSNGMYFLQVIEKGRIVGVEKFVKQ